MKGQDIIDRARIVLNDADAVRWTDAEMVNWINDGCKFIVLLRPDSCVVNQEITCVAGTKQSIASQNPPGLRLLDVVRNSPNGRAVRNVDREVLDTQLPTWHTVTGSATTTNFTFDNRDPKTFYVYPPALVTTKLEIVYSRNPVSITPVTLATTDLSLDDIYLDPLLNYVLARAYGKDASFAQNVNLSAGYLALAKALLEGKTGTDAKFSPDMNSAGVTPTLGAKAGGL